MRFAGQAFEVPVEIDTRNLARLTTSELEARFLAAYRKVYMHAVSPGQAIEVVALRAGATCPTDGVPPLRETGLRGGQPTRRSILIDGKTLDTVFLPIGALSPSEMIPGPAVLQSETSSIFIAQGWRAARDAHDNLVMRKVNS
jgi:N-methylhydantoinase A